MEQTHHEFYEYVYFLLFVWKQNLSWDSHNWFTISSTAGGLFVLWIYKINAGNIATWKQEVSNLWMRSGETKNRTSDVVHRKPRA